MPKLIVMAAGLATLFASAAAGTAAAAPAAAPAAPSEAPSEAPPVMLAAAEARIDVPDTVDPGAKTEIFVFADRTEGQLQLWGPVTEQGTGALLKSVAVEGTTVIMEAPEDPGTYQLRFLGLDNRLRATKTLDVAATPVMLSVPEQLGIGLPAEVRWRGPARPRDMLQIVDPRTDAVVSETPAVGEPGAENVAVLQAPSEPGAYQVRYWSGLKATTLRALPVSVLPDRAWMRAPLQVHGGEDFTVRWHGPVTSDHVVEVVNPETGELLATQPGGERVTLTAPGRGGSYRIRYVDKATGRVHSDLPIIVEPD